MPNTRLLVDAGTKTVLVSTDFSGASDKPLHHTPAIARHHHTMSRTARQE
jgi:hypothetical protein